MKFFPAQFIALFFAGVTLLSLHQAHSAPATDASRISIPAEKPSANSSGSSYSLAWRKGLHDALFLASVEYRPVLALFTSPGCPWCTRLKEETLADPDVQKLLSHFILVEVDVLEDERTAQLYQVRAVPALILLSATGRERMQLNGFINKTNLLKVLNDVLASKLEKQKDSEISAILEKLNANSFEPDKLPSLLLALKDENYRNEVRRSLLKLEPFPRKEFIKLLDHRYLAVRLGALEILEEFTGETFDFDPWKYGSSSNRAAIEKWNAWASSEEKSTSAARRTLLTDETIEGYLQDLVAGHPEKSERAMRMLEKGGSGVLKKLEEFQARTTSLTEAARLRLREMRYILILPPIGNVSSATFAHRLVFGNLDLRMKTLQNITPAGKKAIPVFKDFLSEKEPMLRETAVDSLISAGNRKAVPILEEHLKIEKDTNVIHSALRGLRKITSKRGLNILCGYLQNSDEDLVVVALDSISKLKSAGAADKIKLCLSDQRWRVRAAALETISELRLKELAGEAKKLLNDSDEFVRMAAIHAFCSLAEKDSLQVLEEIFIRDDASKAPVIKALMKLESGVPEHFAKALQGKKPEILLSILDNLTGVDSKSIPFVMELARNNNPDVKLAALRILGARGMDNESCRKMILEQLKSSDRKISLALLQSIEVPEQTLTSYYPSLLSVDFSQPQYQSKTDETQASAVNSMEDVFSAFSETKKTESPNSKVTPSGDEDIFAAFSSGSESSGNEIAELIETAKKHLANNSDAEVRQAAATLLVRLGHTDGAAILLKSASNLTAAQKEDIAENMSRIRKWSAIELFRCFLQDPSENIRKSTVDSLLSKGANEKCLELVFSELVRSGSRLAPHEIYDYQFRQIVSKGEGKRALRKNVESLLSSPNPSLQIFGLVLLEKCWKSEDVEIVKKFLRSNNFWQRRAAAHALGKGNPEKFMEQLPSLLQDPSEHVRLVIPVIYCQNDARWLHYFDESHFAADDISFSYSDRSPPLPDTVKTALHELSRDPSPIVRFEAYFSLLVHQEKFDLSNLIATVDGMADSKAAMERISDYLTSHYRSLGPSFIVLLKYLQSKVEETKRQEIYSYFKIVDDDENLELDPASANLEQKVEATFVAPPPSLSSSLKDQPLKVVYFNKPGCPDCRKVKKMLEQLSESFPQMTVEEHDITKHKSILYNETFCERFKVADNIRLVAPSIFCGAGYLVRDDITFERLGQMLIRSSSVPLEKWYVAPQEDFSQADQAIRKRFAAVSLGVILSAGLLDGMNPCAFATIVFLLSYLQVARRTPRQIAQIGSSYILGVFLAYFLLGLGLVELVSHLMIFQTIGQVVNWIMAIFALVIMVLNIRDGIACLKGDLKDMTLQLPEFLKRKIHTVIREGARHHHFIVMAFGIGIIISFLELACTGQVYAPTIFFMVRSGDTRAIVDLLIYNLAFITPLLTIFILAYSGMRSDALTQFLRKKAAMVKFATAFLFFVIFIFLFFGQRLLVLTS